MLEQSEALKTIATQMALIGDLIIRACNNYTLYSY